MQARSKKLEPVVRHVDNNAQTALQAVAFSQQQLNLQQEILERLYQYKEDYISGDSRLGEQACSAHQLQEFYRFLAQLDDTIRQQKQVVAMAERELEVKREKWRNHRSRSKAMHKVVDRIQASEDRLAQRSEQKFMDEIALRNLHKSQ